MIDPVRLRIESQTHGTTVYDVVVVIAVVVGFLARLLLVVVVAVVIVVGIGLSSIMHV